MTTDPRQLAQEALALAAAAQDAHLSTPAGVQAHIVRLGRLYDMCQPLATALLAALDERDAYRKAKQENDERFMLERDEARRERDELRLTLAAEQGRPEGAPSEGWAYTDGFYERWEKGKVVVQNLPPLGWRWRIGRRKFRDAPTARAAMLAADAATTPCAGPAPASTASPPTGT